MSLDGHLAVDVTDGAVAFAFTVENVGTEPIELEFRSGKVADVAVYNDGVEIWRWSEGRMFTQAIQTETLDPGELLSREVAWDDPRSGAYTAVASLEATTTVLVERIAFAVP
jgi:archaellum component FlaG (FlaF/FlaG flagellin family)